MAISMDRLYARNIPEIQYFLTQNNQELCVFLKDMDSEEDTAQLEEGDYEERGRKWGAVALIGTTAIIGGLSFAYDYKQAYVLNKNFTLNSSSIHKFINEGLHYGGTLGFLAGFTVVGCFFAKSHLSVTGRLGEKIRSIKSRIKNPQNEDVGEVEIQELKISKVFFEKLLNSENNQYNQAIRPTPTNMGGIVRI